MLLRDATAGDVATIGRIYNEGIADRHATLETEPRNAEDMATWWADHGGRYAVLVAETEAGAVTGWASLNRYGRACSAAGIADLSIYVARAARGTGVGNALLAALERRAKVDAFRKIVLFALTKNDRALGLYARFGYREIGVFREHGALDGKYEDVVAMEKLLRPSVLFVCRHNTGRSQMAEGYLRHIAGDAVDVASAGTIAAEFPNPSVVTAMLEDGVDIAAARPKVLEPHALSTADRIITMGCDVEGVTHIDDDWGLPDPNGQTLERVREIRDLVKAKVRELVRDLSADPTEHEARTQT